MGTHTIAKMLDAQNVPTRKGGKWHSNTITDILNNERYVGDILYNKTYTDSSFQRHRNTDEENRIEVKDHHEPIISRELFATAHDVLKQRLKERGIKKGDDKYQRRYAFTGKMVLRETEKLLHYIETSMRHRSSITRSSSRRIRNGSLLEYMLRKSQPL